MYDEVDHLPPEDRKEYIEGVVDRINVGLDPKTKEHVIDIKFKYPIVGDRHEYIDPSKKSKGYEIIDGEITHNLRGSFVSKHLGIKKKSDLKSLQDTQTRTLEQSPSLWSSVVVGG